MCTKFWQRAPSIPAKKKEELNSGLHSVRPPVHVTKELRRIDVCSKQNLELSQSNSDIRTQSFCSTILMCTKF